MGSEAVIGVRIGTAATKSQHWAEWEAAKMTAFAKSSEMIGGMTGERSVGTERWS